MAPYLGYFIFTFELALNALTMMFLIGAVNTAWERVLYYPVAVTL